MKKIFIFVLFYTFSFFNTNLLSNEQQQTLKVGLLAPLTGEYKELGNSLMYSLQLALDEIDDKNVFIVPRDSGFSDKKKLNTAITDLKSQGVKVVIGPISYEDFNEVGKYNDMIFISPSNISPQFIDNVISVGVNLESQLSALKKFLKKQKKNKTIIMFPKNEYTLLIEEKLKNIDFKNAKIFKYNPDPQVLTGEIEKLTNYTQRKRNLELRKKMLEDKDDQNKKLFIIIINYCWNNNNL